MPPTLPASPIPPAPSAAPTAAPTPRHTPLVYAGKVGEYTLTITCEGSGSPTILLENGLDSIAWSYPKFSHLSQTCTYARVGMGAEPAKYPRTSLDQVKDLHALLQQAKIPGPYLLVGHSIAGYNLLLFTDEYPEEVVGLVCVDCRYPAFDTIFMEKLKTKFAGDSNFKSKIQVLTQTYFLSALDPTIFANNREGLDLFNSARQVLKIATLGNRPFVVLLATDHYWYTNRTMRVRDPEKEPVMTLLEESWIMAGELLSKLSSQGRVEIVMNTHHETIVIHDAVEKAVREVFEKVNTH